MLVHLYLQSAWQGLIISFSGSSLVVFSSSQEWDKNEDNIP